jgi:uncharacterized protein YyaL (SSP411 family)
MSANRLGAETSPYLLQHADNPVHWWAWGADALAEAKRTDRPILLSIGYAACHWCHVMAHESFENPDVAAVMNELFVNIKVDREERPDIDAIYQQALALLGQHGGWPLTMFCTPAGEPFWGGTYFPYPSRFGRPAFDDVLRAVSAAYRDKKEQVETNRTALLQALQERAQSAAAAGGTVSLDLTDRIAQRLLQEVDMAWGGFGQAPKFPSPYVFELLWRAWLRGGRRDAQLFDAVTVTLDRICQGGIYDHLGGGFSRYATDNEWKIPHFEKMLYDNAQLIDLLVMVWQETRSPLYAQRITETCDWVLREMIAGTDAARGGFAATFDADSEGEEGKFYVWTAEEIDAVLGSEDGAFFRRAYDVSREGNWEHGNSILHRNRRPALLDASEEQRLADLRARLKPVRDRRIWPGWDDKVLADWNGLMIAALANAGSVFGRRDWLDAAVDAFAFVGREMRDTDGRLFHSWRNGMRRHRATLDDYANVARAALVLAESTGGNHYVDEAVALLAVLDRHYADPAGGYFYTADDADDVIVRGKHAHDNAVPAGNGTLVGVFARLWTLTGADTWRDRAERQVAAFAAEVERNFFPLMTLLNGNETLQSATAIVIVGDHSDAATMALARTVRELALPNKVVQHVSPGTDLPASHPAHGKTTLAGRPTAYVCRGTTCSPPVTDAGALRQALVGPPGAL